MMAQRIRVKGRVQGVGFRWSAAEAARELCLHGWIRNEPDGSVLAWVQGDEANVAAFRTWMHQGPPGCHVSAYQVDDVSPDPHCTQFRITV